MLETLITMSDKKSQAADSKGTTMVNEQHLNEIKG